MRLDLANLPRSGGIEGLARNPAGTLLYAVGGKTPARRSRRRPGASSWSSIPARHGFTGNFWLYRADREDISLASLEAFNDRVFLVLERDTGEGPAAEIKRIYRIDLDDLDDDGYLNKTLVCDLMNIDDARGLTRAEERRPRPGPRLFLPLRHARMPGRHRRPHPAGGQRQQLSHERGPPAARHARRQRVHPAAPVHAPWPTETDRPWKRAPAHHLLLSLLLVFGRGADGLLFPAARHRPGRRPPARQRDLPRVGRAPGRRRLGLERNLLDGSALPPLPGPDLPGLRRGQRRRPAHPAGAVAAERLAGVPVRPGPDAAEDDGWIALAAAALFAFYGAAGLLRRHPADGHPGHHPLPGDGPAGRAGGSRTIPEELAGPGACWRA